MREKSAFRQSTSGQRALRYIVPLMIFVVTLLGGCSSWRGIHPHACSVKGRTVNPQGQAVTGVEVRLGDRRVTVTDRNGRFRFCVFPRKGRLAVSFSAPKFMSTTRIYDTAAVSADNTIVIWPRATPAPLRASEGGKLEFNGATIVFPPDAFVDSKGRQVKGDVNVSLSVLDVTDPRQLASAPGDFTARMRNGSIRSLETFGLFELVVADGRGRPVNFAPDRTARVELNVPDGRREVPRSVGSFSFDERSGRWNEQSSFQVQSSQETFVTQVGLSGWWNADLEYDTTCLKAQVLSCRGCEAKSVGVQGVTVTATGTDYTGAVSKGATDGSGFVCLPAKKAAHVRLDVSKGSLHGNPLEVATDPGVVDPAICVTCPSGTPLVTATHLRDASFTAPLTAHDPTVWCASNYWNGSTTEFENAWLHDPTHVKFSASGLTLTLNDKDESGQTCDPNGTNCKGSKFASGEYKTKCFHGYGTYTATITPPAWSSTNANQGIVTGFFTLTRDDVYDGTIGENNTPGWDEIDIEILGRWRISTDNDTPGHQCTDASLVVQTNYIGKTVGFGVNEKVYCLPYGTHTYSFTWSDSSISWSYVDSNNVSHLLRVEQRNGNPKWPTQPGRVYMNVWANNTGQSWVGPFSYHGPVEAVFSNVSVPP